MAALLGWSQSMLNSSAVPPIEIEGYVGDVCAYCAKNAEGFPLYWVEDHVLLAYEVARTTKKEGNNGNAP